MRGKTLLSSAVSFLLTFRFSTTKQEQTRILGNQPATEAIYANLCVSPLDMFCVLLCSHPFHARVYKTLVQLQFNHLSFDIVRLYSRVSFAFVIVSILFHGILKTSCLVRNINAAVKRSVFIDSESQRLRYCWCHFCCFSVKLAFIWV